MSPTRRPWLFVFALALLFVAGSISAAAQTVKTERQSDTVVTVRPATPEEVRAMADAVSALTSEEDKDLKVVQHKNGMQSVDLKGRFQSIAIVKRNSDGTVSTKCVEKPEEAAKFVGTTEQAPKQPVVKKTEGEER
jgi:hypothetical protein